MGTTLQLFEVDCENGAASVPIPTTPVVRFQSTSRDRRQKYALPCSACRSRGWKKKLPFEPRNAAPLTAGDEPASAAERVTLKFLANIHVCPSCSGKGAHSLQDVSRKVGSSTKELRALLKGQTPAKRNRAPLAQRMGQLVERLVDSFPHEFS